MRLRQVFALNLRKNRLFSPINPYTSTPQYLRQVRRRQALEIVFQNENFVVIDKPPGVLSVPSRQGAQDERRCAGRELEQNLGIRLWPAHRLDFEVSGLLIFAKTAHAHSAASQWFEARTIKKEYEAWTEAPKQEASLPIGHEQVWKCTLVRGKKRAFEASYGKLALTYATCIEGFSQGGIHCLRWKLRPETGRSHQLRYELARHGFPILGDDLYGSKQIFGENSIALRALFLDLSKIAEPERLGLPNALKVLSFEERFRA